MEAYTGCICWEVRIVHKTRVNEKDLRHTKNWWYLDADYGNLPRSWQFTS